MRSLRGATAIFMATALMATMASTVAAQDEVGDGGSVVLFWMVLIVMLLLIVASMASAMVVIKPWEIGLKLVLGKYVGRMKPGLNTVPPFITKVMRVDLRETTLDVPRQEVTFRDKERGEVDARMIVKVVDPEMATFQVVSWELATVALAQTVLRNKVLELTFDELVDNKELLNQEFVDKMHEDMDPWGVKVRKFDIREMREN